MTSPDIYAMSLGRLGAIVGVLLGLMGVVMGGLALARSSARRAAAGVKAGLIGLALGGLIWVTSSGGVGTGKGVGGAIVAMAVGLLGTILGGLALARSRRDPSS
jgi:hypothetical protein